MPISITLSIPGLAPALNAIVAELKHLNATHERIATALTEAPRLEFTIGPISQVKE